MRLPAHALHPAPNLLHEDAAEEETVEHRDRELEFASFREARHTVIRITGDRLRKGTRWHGRNYDFTGTVFDGDSLSRARFTGGVVDFSETEFSGGNLSFYETGFTGGTVYSGAARLTGEVSFEAASGSCPDHLQVLALISWCGDSPSLRGGGRHGCAGRPPLGGPAPLAHRQRSGLAGKYGRFWFRPSFPR